ncbi:hypothetical protein [Janibacter terrae]|uniref:hypothetical protein n=1 Tax=Janibacter terrae TaxID=103817 RepID=UPI00082F23F0|nr:hypothetical protein [Janibacter terrae]
MSIELGAVIVGVVAVAYGLGFAVVPDDGWSPSARSRYVLGGAGLVALLFFVLVVVPWFIGRG